MNNLNSLIIEGNVVKPGNLVEPVPGFKKCLFPIAVNRWYRNKDGEGNTEVSYFDIEAYGKMAEVCETQTTKGRGLRVVGRLKQDRWNDQDGKAHSRVYVVAEHIEYKPKLKKEDSEAITSDDSESPVVDESMAVETQLQEKVPAAEQMVF